MREEDSEADGFARGFHGIPHAEKLRTMPFVDLAEELAGSAKDSAKFITVERELKRRLAEDQAKTNRSNVLLGAIVGGCFGLAGVVIGWYLRDSQTSSNPAHGSTVQQTHQGKLEVKPPNRYVPASNPTISQPAVAPSPVQPNAQASQSRP